MSNEPTNEKYPNKPTYGSLFIDSVTFTCGCARRKNLVILCNIFKKKVS